MSILLCSEVEERFSSYMDSTLSGADMAEMREHMRHCPQCTRSFKAWQVTVQALTTLTPVRPPREMALRLRVAVSHEKSRSLRNSLQRFRVRWENTFAPFAVRASAGLASAVVMLGGGLLLVGALASPEPAAARNDPSATATQPRLLYMAHPDGTDPLAALDGTVVVRAFIDEHGRVYDYKVLSGPETATESAALADSMMWSVFQPARVFGEPVPGSVVVSLAGVSVSG